MSINNYFQVCVLLGAMGAIAGCSDVDPETMTYCAENPPGITGAYGPLNWIESISKRFGYWGVCRGYMNCVNINREGDQYVCADSKSTNFQQ